MSESNAPPTTHKAQGGKGVLITTPALDQLSRLCKEQGSGKLLRVGVRSGGCSGMSYTMDFVSDDDIQKDDEVYESIEDIWPDYPDKDDFFFNEEEY